MFDFYDEKISKNLTKFTEFKNIFSIIDSIVKKIINLKSKKSQKEKTSKNILKNYDDKNAFYIQNKNDIDFLRTSLPLSFFQSKTYNTEEDLNVKSSYTSKNVNVGENSKKPNTEEKGKIENLEDIEFDDNDEDDEENENASKSYKYSRMCSSNIMLSEDQFNINNINQEEDDKDEKDENKEVKGFLRFNNKKAATVGGSLSKINNLEMKLFNFQQEEEDNNFILKKTIPVK